jgi:hypothetical protein
MMFEMRLRFLSGNEFGLSITTMSAGFWLFRRYRVFLFPWNRYYKINRNKRYGGLR